MSQMIVPGYNKTMARLSGLMFLPFAFATLLMVIYMNKSLPEPEKTISGPMIEFNVNRPKPKKKKEPERVRREPPKKAQAKPITPPPDLGVSFSGVDFGLPEFSFGGVATITDDMVGDMDNMLMTEDAVDSKPEVKFQPPLNYPPRARANNVEGRVVLWLIVGADGRAKNIKVKESSPPGVFDEAAVTCISGTRFEPAKYKGRPVEMSVVVPIDFALN